MATYGCPWGGPAYLRGTSDGTSRFRFSLLEKRLRTAYLEMEAGLITMDREIVLEGVDIVDVRGIYDAVRFDNPCIPLIRQMKTATRFGAICLLPVYFLNKQKHEADVSHLAEIGDRFIESIHGSRFDRELAVHDYLSDTVLYSKERPSDFSMSGPLLYHRGACEGISKAALYLLRRIGVDAGIVSGITTSGERHAWNMVHIDDRCYHLDITWDLGSRNGVTRHDFFNVNDGFMGKTRSWTNTYPSVSMNDNYYSRRGTVVYRTDDLEKVIGSFISKRQETIEFRISDAIKDSIDGDVVERSIRKALGICGGKFSGSYCQSTGCCLFNVDYL